MTNQDKTLKFKNVCFTLNNYTEDEYNDIFELKYTYIIVGREIGENKTPHLQGYIEFKNAVRLSTLKKFNPRIHWEVRKGTAKQAAEYCKKENTYVEDGIISNQGKRTDLENMAKLCRQKKPLKEIADSNPECYIKYYKGIEQYLNLQYEPRQTKPIVTWYYGQTGTGKTRRCVERHTSSYYIKDSTKWWNGYTQQEAIIIDDFTSRTWEIKDLLRLLDRYPYQGEMKGSYIHINSPYIYITCDQAPDKLYTEKDYAQLKRRINIIEEVKDYETPHEIIDDDKEYTLEDLLG